MAAVKILNRYDDFIIIGLLILIYTFSEKDQKNLKTTNVFKLVTMYELQFKIRQYRSKIAE